VARGTFLGMMRTNQFPTSTGTKMKQTWFVIVTGSQQQRAPANFYIAQDASPTMMRSNAARFFSFSDAQEFAEENHIRSEC